MTFLYLNSIGMGNGPNERLSKKLLEIFLEKIAGSDKRIDMVGCVNGGVLLTTTEGSALESLKKLQDRGAIIASCGTCLDHLGLKDKLKIGKVGSMADTIEIMTTADKIINPC